LFGEKSTIAPVAWSLEIEIQFYLLAPIVARTFAIDGKLERRTLLVVLILVGCAVQPLMNNWRLNVLMFAQCFLVGFLMADIYVSEWKSSPAKAWRWDALALAAGALLFALTGSITRVWWSPPTHSADQWVDPVWCALACLGLLALFAAAFRGRVTNAFLSIPYVSVIGGMCYTIYLYHEHVFSFVGRLAMRAHFTETFAGNYLLGIALMVPFTLAVTSALFVAFEKPFMRRVWAARLTIHTQTR
jgi:peptidoglycan/LPS O-acetylase OafA/YrhL